MSSHISLYPCSLLLQLWKQLNLQLEISDFHLLYEPPDPTTVPKAVVIFAGIVLFEIAPYALLCQLADKELVVPFFVAETVVHYRDVEIPKVREEFTIQKALPIYGLKESSALDWEVLYWTH
jgi:hypothetical protein